MDKTSGNDDFPTTHPIMRRAKLMMFQVEVYYQR